MSLIGDDDDDDDDDNNNNNIASMELGYFLCLSGLTRLRSL
jgi:hypothetical protein